ncbi:MAG: septal ring lytic transglycosylase RlpA family protein [Stenomitos rutilans HA7619-LM2]|jgi:rare lipoprotein A|nr:septal ring lytic transglycosylase RlpA family protein [Stenomitos rutilans HA7619-LM2]
MPIFGLVWVASWVNCFFSSSQDLLRAPSYLANILPTQTTTHLSGAQTALLLPTVHDRHDIALSDASLKRSFGQSIQPFHTVSSASALLPFHRDTPLPSLGFLSAFKGLLSGFQKLTAVNNAPSVVVTPVDPKQLAVERSHYSSTAGVGFDQCLSLAPEQPSTSKQAALKHRLFQVKVKGHVVSTAPKQQQAVRIAHRLEQVLSEVKPPLQQLQPGIVNGVPVGQIGDRVLFKVDQQVAAQWDCTPEMLAIQWINDLRMAVAEPPLSLADAQAKMYGLQATGAYIEGLASWYGPYFHGRQTATGETFNQDGFTAAHPSLPFDTFLKVTNVENGKSVIVRVNDRGPYFENRTLDLSREAARCLGSENVGVVTVEAEIMQSAKSPIDISQTIAQRL